MIIKTRTTTFASPAFPFSPLRKNNIYFSEAFRTSTILQQVHFPRFLIFQQKKEENTVIVRLIVVVKRGKKIASTNFSIIFYLHQPSSPLHN